jgi:hypothetical protein
MKTILIVLGVILTLTTIAFASVRFISESAVSDWMPTRQQAVAQAASEAQSHLAYECRDGWMSDVRTDAQCGYDGRWACIVHVRAYCNTDEGK